MTRTHPFVPSLDVRRCICGDMRQGAVHYSQAVARGSDPDTSWEAAHSLSSEKIRQSQIEVLELFRAEGPMTDEAARRRYRGTQSASGFRTRRAELVDRLLLIDTGRRERGATGRRMIVWAAR